ncbi:hypothetical protein PTTG_02158 [Puccinia triticina 1-1 BBBD Race 1]|uniref:Uncharacterized protein n=2 Tax=Puccinia triticina TaxID=208348 RepID=A0A180GUE3_PUCT1|nr:uncharacterized protein PtA15_5A201 [Puccinia triticina]OAV96144.1 hypothetical protein PTTG_02158 [Puccinia triticina 1-1 BBBD Race 1]WAQ84628.1 hypothetical protein PtA15_5A201 [Puccinia triticina]WAR57977.1 hypothetical protein PtB15_5B207 [Puccinia triticina]
MSSGNVGIHSSHIMFHRAQRDYERLQESYNQWLKKREKTKQDILKQIASINEAALDAKKSAKLSKLKAQLSAFEEEEAEVPDAELLQHSPHARPCHRPAYRKLAFENALKQSEEKKRLAEDVYNAAQLAKQASAPVPSEPAAEPAEAEAQEAPPPTPEAATSSVPRPMSRIKKLDAYLTKLESGRGMTKTFAPERQSPTYGKWSLRAGTFQPGRDKPASSS